MSHIKGGQGREPEDLERSAHALTILALLAVIGWLAVYGAYALIAS